MKVSLNWVRNFTSVDLSDEELIGKIGAQLGAVEETEHTGKKYQGILVVKVIECAKHPNADKLSLCLVDDGGVNKTVKRTPNGLIQVVCGAPNAKAGMLAAWIPPGAVVPSSDKDPFVIEARPIRNKTSHGMLASAKELAIGDDHDGILEIDKQAEPGASFGDLYKMDDLVIDIENKMFTHRPDCFGMLGIARELAGIQHAPFKSPDWYQEDAAPPADGRKNVLKLSVKNDLPKLVPRFCAVAIKDVRVGPSPVWLRASLSRVGVKSINNVVDLTNFYMLLTAQPLHAYDYDKLKTGRLGVRWSKKGEKLKLIGDKTIKLDHAAIVITDGTKPVGLGGVMGGADTGVDENTKNIILEAATFDMNTTRRTAMAYGLFTDAATRFTKNQSPRQNMAVLAKAAEDIKRLAGGRTASPVADAKNLLPAAAPVKTGADFVNSRLGLSLSAAEIKKLLENVEFKVESGKGLVITPPFWRTDIEIAEDIVEEVGRLYGYDKLPVVLPERDLTPSKKDPKLQLQSRLREILKQGGANEVLTYSFVPKDLMLKAGQDPDNAYHIRNAVSPDLQYYRLSLMPSLLEKVHVNSKAGFDRFALFEIGKGHVKGELDKQGLPKEFARLALVVASSGPGAGAAYYAAKDFCGYLLDELGIQDISYHPMAPNPKLAAPTYYEPLRSAEVKSGDLLLGRVGEFKSGVKASLKLPAFCAGFELHINDLLELAGQASYQPLNRFPELEQDFCLRSDAALSYQTLTDFMHSNLGLLSREPGYGFRIEPLDIFQKPKDKAHKQTTWRIILWHPKRTLTTSETNKLLDGLADKAKKELKAERI